MTRLMGWLVLAALGAAPAAAQDGPANLYPLKLGSKWTFRIPGSDDKFVITAAGTETVGGQACVRLEARVQGTVVATEHVAVLKDGVYRFKMNDAQIEPPLCFCKFPARKGEAWKADFKVGKEKASIAFQVDEEELTVPAGKYRAVAVKGEVTERGNIVQTVYWFAPEIGVVKQHLNFGGNQVDLELEKFEPGS